MCPLVSMCIVIVKWWYFFCVYIFERTYATRPSLCRYCIVMWIELKFEQTNILYVSMKRNQKREWKKNIKCESWHFNRFQLHRIAFHGNISLASIIDRHRCFFKKMINKVNPTRITNHAPAMSIECSPQWNSVLLPFTMWGRFDQNTIWIIYLIHWKKARPLQMHTFIFICC